MSSTDKQPRIAIIGAGPAGLSAAWFLKRNGYKKVRVFEKTDRVGGKCLTFEHGGHRFDLAAHEMLAGYNDVMDIANALGVPTVGYQNVLVFDTGNRRYLSMMEASQTGGYGKLQILWASLRYTWMLLTRYRKFARPGSGYAGAPPELVQPLSSWIQQKQLGALLETIMYVMRVQGYGRLDEIPAAYFVKFQGLRNWVSNVLHVAGLIQGWPRIFKDGFQSLWDAVAPHVDLVLNAKISSVRREPPPDRSNIVVTIGFADGRPDEEFDYVIVTCPLDLPTLEGASEGGATCSSTSASEPARRASSAELSQAGPTMRSMTPMPSASFSPSGCSRSAWSTLKVSRVGSAPPKVTSSRRPVLEEGRVFSTALNSGPRRT